MARLTAAESSGRPSCARPRCASLPGQRPHAPCQRRLAMRRGRWPHRARRPRASSRRAAPAARPEGAGSGAPGRPRPTSARQAPAAAPGRGRRGRGSCRGHAPHPAAPPGRCAGPRPGRRARRRRTRRAPVRRWRGRRARRRWRRLPRRRRALRERRRAATARGPDGCARHRARPFVRARRKLLDLGDLPGQPFALALEIALAAARRFERLQGRTPGGPALAEQARIEPRIRIEHAPYRGGPSEALPGMLAVDIDQMLAGFAQLRHGGTAAVDPGPALSLRIDGAAHEQRPASPASGSKPASASQGTRAGGRSNSAVISARAAPSRTTPASPRPPRASCKASTRIDLPAPVSPVSTGQPPPRDRAQGRRR